MEVDSVSGRLVGAIEMGKAALAPPRPWVIQTSGGEVWRFVMRHSNHLMVPNGPINDPGRS